MLYCGWPGEEVRITGGKAVTGWKPVSDEKVLERLVPEARGKVVQADLKALGITDYGKVNGGGLELFFEDQPMTLARWPNEGFVKIAGLVGPDTVNVRGTKGSKRASSCTTATGPSGGPENDVWVHGYWFWDWADQRQKVESIDTEKRMIIRCAAVPRLRVSHGPMVLRAEHLGGARHAGRMVLDREKGILYFWPPTPIEKGTCRRIRGERAGESHRRLACDLRGHDF